MAKVVVFNIGDGNFEQGFPVTLQIGEEGKQPRTERGHFPPAPDIPRLYREFQEKYNNLEPVESVRRTITVDPGHTTNFSTLSECKEAAEALEDRLTEWFRHPFIEQLRLYIEEDVHKKESARIIFQTDNEILKKLPWHLWRLFRNRRKAWLSLSSKYNRPSEPLKRPVRILAILGSNEGGIDNQRDGNFLQNLPGAKVEILPNPKRSQLCEKLREEEESWDIVCFSGHSSSDDGGNDGVFHINNIDSRGVSAVLSGRIS